MSNNNSKDIIFFIIGGIIVSYIASYFIGDTSISVGDMITAVSYFVIRDMYIIFVAIIASFIIGEILKCSLEYAWSKLNRKV
jgi:hypothetical protein